jgi:HAD superfamily hydrolase (TIGR01490 family)
MGGAVPYPDIHARTRHPAATARNSFGLDWLAVGTSAAFFDLDKTVIAKSSALAFGRPFYRDGLITRRDAVKAAYAHLAFKIGGADDASLAKIRDYVAELCKGWSADQVGQIVDETLHELIKPYVYAEAAALISEHQATGRDVVLVSASGEEFVRPIGAQLDVSDVIATRMKVVDGVYTGEIDFYAAGPGKVSAVKELAGERGYDLGECFAYSDSISDAPLLEIVGHPTAVNPDRALRKLATERSWQILEFRRPVPLGARMRKQLLERPTVPVAAAATVGVAIGIAWYGHRRRSRSAG